MRKWHSVIYPVVIVGFLLGCGKSQEAKDNTRDRNEILRAMVAQFETWATERNPDAFADYITEKFDAAAFIDAMWSGVDARRVVFKIRQLRVSPKEGRAVIDAAFMDGDVMKAGQFVVISFIPVEGEWKANSYQLFGPNRK